MKENFYSTQPVADLKNALAALTDLLTQHKHCSYSPLDKPFIKRIKKEVALIKTALIKKENIINGLSQEEAECINKHLINRINIIMVGENNEKSND